MSIVTVKSIWKYALIAIALLLVGMLSIGAVGNAYAQISQPIAQIGGGVRIAQPYAQGGYMGSSVVSAPFVSNRYMPGYDCYQSYAGGPFTCYPTSSGAYGSGGNYVGNYYSSGGIYQPVQQTGFGTQIAAPYARI
ncbi:MAG TPA: hypothetical protein VGJ92_11510 [Methanocella sp.]